VQIHAERVPWDKLAALRVLNELPKVPLRVIKWYSRSEWVFEPVHRGPPPLEFTGCREYFRVPSDSPSDNTFRIGVRVPTPLDCIRVAQPKPRYQQPLSFQPLQNPPVGRIFKDLELPHFL
jgi:hypothetical protein